MWKDWSWTQKVGWPDESLWRTCRKSQEGFEDVGWRPFWIHSNQGWEKIHWERLTVRPFQLWNSVASPGLVAPPTPKEWLIFLPLWNHNKKSLMSEILRFRLNNRAITSIWVGYLNSQWFSSHKTYISPKGNSWGRMMFQTSCLGFWYVSGSLLAFVKVKHVVAGTKSSFYKVDMIVSYRDLQSLICLTPGDHQIKGKIS